MNDVAFWIVIILVMAYDWDVGIVDTKTAFLYRNLDKERFMKVPEGLAEHFDTVFDDNICLVLVQSMYCLVQAARQYYKKFIEVIVTKLGFKKCLAYACLLKQTNDKGTLIVCVYVDKMLCVGDRAAIDLLKIKLAKHFEVKDKGKMEECVGCSVV